MGGVKGFRVSAVWGATSESQQHAGSVVEVAPWCTMRQAGPGRSVVCDTGILEPCPDCVVGAAQAGVSIKVFVCPRDQCDTIPRRLINVGMVARRLNKDALALMQPAAQKAAVWARKNGDSESIFDAMSLDANGMLSPQAESMCRRMKEIHEKDFPALVAFLKAAQPEYKVIIDALGSPELRALRTPPQLPERPPALPTVQQAAEGGEASSGSGAEDSEEGAGVSGEGAGHSEDEGESEEEGESEDGGGPTAVDSLFDTPAGEAAGADEGQPKAQRPVLIYNRTIRGRTCGVQAAHVDFAVEKGMPPLLRSPGPSAS